LYFLIKKLPKGTELGMDKKLNKRLKKNQFKAKGALNLKVGIYTLNFSVELKLTIL